MSFNLWAPTARSVELLELDQPPRSMPRDDDGWYQLLSQTARAGTRYQFRINQDLIGWRCFADRGQFRRSGTPHAGGGTAKPCGDCTHLAPRDYCRATLPCGWGSRRDRPARSACGVFPLRWQFTAVSPERR
ncbi:hypothetical protein LRP30_30950 [Bradyrhizobium sp. C-145]|uniref:hypothetical protein n=1 Tax=Bradyrhizobium sp. C-145 TaxID=574727 RepID=UPI00201B97BF|nr:hypothetical protein [Bradyrhizobium sp. C-145]UQR61340.1 hypothetical protein LRP30_30950 [Bradyrhizobium sp. C-145]